MAGRGQQDQRDQGKYAKYLKGEARKLAVTGIGKQQGLVFVRAGKGKVPIHDVGRMGQRHKNGHHTKMAAVINQRQKPIVEPRQWSDAQDDAQHGKRAGPKSAGVMYLRIDLALIPQQAGRGEKEDT